MTHTIPDVLDSMFRLSPIPISLAARKHQRTHKMACTEERKSEEIDIDAKFIETAAYMMISVHAHGPSSRCQIRQRMGIGNVRMVDALDYLVGVGGLEIDQRNTTKIIMGHTTTGLRKQGHMLEGLMVVLDECARISAKNRQAGQVDMKLWRPFSRKLDTVKKVTPPRTHCKYGHPISGKNLLIDRRGAHWCKTCKEIVRMLQSGKLKEDPRLHGVKLKKVAA